MTEVLSSPRPDTYDHTASFVDRPYQTSGDHLTLTPARRDSQSNTQTSLGLHEIEHDASSVAPSSVLPPGSSTGLLHPSYPPGQHCRIETHSPERPSVSLEPDNPTGRATYREFPGPENIVRDPGALTPVVAPPLGETAPPGPHVPSPPEERFGFYPMSVDDIFRYKHRKIRHPTQGGNVVAAMTYQYPKTPGGIKKGWLACQHPEGALYFVDIKSKTFTEVNICDSIILKDIEYSRDHLFQMLKREIGECTSPSESLKTDEVQLVLEPKKDKNDAVVCCYYFVNPKARCLFWLHDWDGPEIFKDCKGKLSLPHQGLGIEAQYWFARYAGSVISKISMSLTPWKHWDFYPNFCEVTPKLKAEVMDLILHATYDHLTSDTSSFPLNLKELKGHLSLIERINTKKPRDRKHGAIIIGRIMHIFYNNYFLNYHGEECARLNFDQTVHGWEYHPSLQMQIFTRLSFMVPMNNVQLLHETFVDGIVSKEKWTVFIRNLKSQLQETRVLAIVLLNANVAFLPKQSGTWNSPEQLLNCMSLVASMASIILGLVFVGYSCTGERNTALKAATFLRESWDEKQGLEKLAIVYSLPHAFLVWGMCFFFAAFVAQWFSSSNTEFQITAGVIIGVVAWLVVWCIWATRDRNSS